MLIFDLDGTLIDSAADIGNSLNLTLAELGEEPFSEERILEQVGSGILSLLKERFPNQNQLQEARSIFDRQYMARLCNQTTVFSGISHLLTATRNTPKVVLTNKSQRYADPIVSQLFSPGAFVGVYGGDAFDRPKPDPLPIEKILEIHEGDKSVTWMIGDSSADVRSGKSAGVKTCGVLYGYTPPEDLLREEADVYVKNSDELLDVLCP